MVCRTPRRRAIRNSELDALSRLIQRSPVQHVKPAVTSLPELERVRQMD